MVTRFRPRLRSRWEVQFIILGLNWDKVGIYNFGYLLGILYYLSVFLFYFMHSFSFRCAKNNVYYFPVLWKISVTFFILSIKNLIFATSMILFSVSQNELKQFRKLGHRDAFHKFCSFFRLFSFWSKYWLIQGLYDLHLLILFCLVTTLQLHNVKDNN